MGQASEFALAGNASYLAVIACAVHGAIIIWLSRRGQFAQTGSPRCRVDSSVSSYVNARLGRQRCTGPGKLGERCIVGPVAARAAIRACGLGAVRPSPDSGEARRGCCFTILVKSPHQAWGPRLSCCPTLTLVVNFQPSLLLSGRVEGWLGAGRHFVASR
jgi:hypothetical protein